VDQTSAFGIITQFVPAEYLIYVAVSVAALIFFLFLMLVMYKLRSGRATAPDLTLSFDDVSSLKEKGLLTEEEMKRVRAAMARQVAGRLSAKRPTTKPETLLYDPEVIALEEKARAKQSQMPADEHHGAEQPQKQPEPPADEVPLPPGIETLAEQGLITPEELAAIRKRAAERKQPDP
jgi:hypothetical protein